MPQRSSLLSFLLLPAVLYSLSGCEEPCAQAVCSENSELNIILVDSMNKNLIQAGVFTQDQIHMLSHKLDTLPAVFNEDAGLVSIIPSQDQSDYTVVVGGSAFVDLTVYQHYSAPPNECCPGFWKIDSVYAYQEKLKKSPDLDGFMLKVD